MSTLCSLQSLLCYEFARFKDSLVGFYCIRGSPSILQSINVSIIIIITMVKYIYN